MEFYEAVSASKTDAELYDALSKFVVSCSDLFCFGDIPSKVKCGCATSIGSALSKADYHACHQLCLESLRIISRDKTEIENWVTDSIVSNILIKAAYNGSAESIETSTGRVLEAIKCLSNMLYNSCKAISHCAKRGIVDKVLFRIDHWDDIGASSDIRYFDLKTLFLLTALDRGMCIKARNDLNAVGVLINVLDKLVSEIQTSDSYKLSDVQFSIVAESLKVLFNLLMNQRKSKSKESDAADGSDLRNLVSLCRQLLLSPVATNGNDVELQSNVVNLLSLLPGETYRSLLVPVEPEVAAREGIPNYQGYDMRSIDILLLFLSIRLNSAPPGRMDIIGPVLSSMVSISDKDVVIRKYLKFKVLPPLKNEIYERPEYGDSLRNKLVRLMTSVTDVKHLAAAFLYVLCGRNVNRLVKYTGFGNAAGLIADFGLLGGFANQSPEAPVEDDGTSDSDTEEYTRVRDQINPVLGCVQPEIPDPFANMSDEQKEYEVMKLVNSLDKLTRTGVIKPGRINAEGKLEAVEHVLQFQEGNVDPTKMSQELDNE